MGRLYYHGQSPRLQAPAVFQEIVLPKSGGEDRAKKEREPVRQ